MERGWATDESGAALAVESPVRGLAAAVAVGLVLVACSESDVLVVYNATGSDLSVLIRGRFFNKLKARPWLRVQYHTMDRLDGAELTVVSAGCTYQYDLPDLSHAYYDAGAPGRVDVNVQMDKAMRVWLLSPVGAKILQGAALRAAQEPGYPVTAKSKTCLRSG